MKINQKFKRAIVTGGAGFIGSHLVDELLDHGLEVISIDDYSGGKSENLAHLTDKPQFKEVVCDVTDFHALSPYFEGVDVVFHQACSKNTVCMKNPARDLAVNAEGTLNMLHQAKAHGVKKFVHASTGSVYGEPYLFPSNESHPLNPVSYYGVSKLCGEKYVRLFSDLHGMDTVILRYYHVFGPRQEYSDVGGVVSIFGRRAVQGKPLIIYGDGTQLRSFTYVQDVVGINLLVAMTDGISGESYNCASGIKVTIQELAEAVLKYFGREDLEIQYQDWKPGDIKKFDVDNKKLKALGFNFQYEFNIGLSKTLDWSKEFFASEAD